MQESYSYSDWHEDPTEEKLRAGLNRNSSPGLARRLYPLRGRLLSKDQAYGFPTGHIFTYARTKDCASTFPIEVCAVLETGGRHGSMITAYHFTSDEVELLSAQG